MSLFELAIPIILRHEGGLIDDPKDSGGLTNFGISQRSYPEVDIRALTAATASDIYRRDWWDRYNYGAILAQALAVKIFDTAVNLGAPRAHRMVQEVLGVAQDGVIGPLTLNLLNTVNSLNIIVSLQNRQAQFYRDLVEANPAQAKFLGGWINRAYDRS
jgi:lysozyme family protein